VSSVSFAESDTNFDLPGLAKRTRKAVLLITGFDSSGKIIQTGSGFFISADGRMVTNWHVVAEIAAAEAKTENGAVYKIDGVIASSPTLDLAVLQARAKEVEFLDISRSDPPDVGAHIAIVGSPLALEGTLTDGIVSAVRKDESGTWLQITAPVSPGSSG